ncbi:hypothetical protein UK99_12825 [Frankia casuarinae]|nr:hypothetical protein [Frankia sp. Allo2]ORT95450.1 hypothetical protein UK99_12825 [Frankia casuarinae]
MNEVRAEYGINEELPGDPQPAEDGGQHDAHRKQDEQDEQALPTHPHQGGTLGVRPTLGTARRNIHPRIVGVRTRPPWAAGAPVLRAPALRILASRPATG